ncbi:MAG: N-acetylmuramic acid 6-phosphate etherase [Erysipelotrichaceae bacterium]
MDLSTLETEQRNPRSMNIDHCDTLELITIINREDQEVPRTIEHMLPTVAATIEEANTFMQRGGRLIYMGAGTSGRLGVLDASECPPTYGVSPELVVGLMAGGLDAIIKAKEGAEDSPQLGVEDLKSICLTANDVVVGLAASGRTPYVIGGLDYANQVGALTIAISCVSDAEISKHAKHRWEAVVGAEVITGSTRMKAGTAQKLLCNMLSTSLMVKRGKVYKNLMVDVQPTNEKLVERAKRIIAQAAEISYEDATHYFEASGKDVKVAIMMALTQSDAQSSMALLAQNQGNVAKAIHANK